MTEQEFMATLTILACNTNAEDKAAMCQLIVNEFRCLKKIEGQSIEIFNGHVYAAPSTKG